MSGSLNNEINIGQSQLNTAAGRGRPAERFF